MLDLAPRGARSNGQPAGTCGPSPHGSQLPESRSLQTCGHRRRKPPFLPCTPIDSQASPGMRHCDDGGPAGVADEGARGGAAGFLFGLGDWRFLRRIDPRLGQELVRLQPIVFDLERLSRAGSSPRSSVDRPDPAARARSSGFRCSRIASRAPRGCRPAASDPPSAVATQAGIRSPMVPVCGPLRSKPNKSNSRLDDLASRLDAGSPTTPAPVRGEGAPATA